MSNDINNSLYKQEQRERFQNKSGRNLLIIAFVFATIIVFCVYWFSRNQSNPDKKTALQTGYGWYADPIIGPCITSDGKCGDDGQLTVTKHCVPHPVSLKGCKDSDGTMTYNTLVEYRHCNLQCIGSNFSVQNAVEIYKGVSINGITEVPIHIGGHYVIDKNSGIEYTDQFIGNFNYESGEYDIKGCIKDSATSNDNFISYSVTTHECNEYDKRGPNNCFYRCNEYQDVLRQPIAYNNSNPNGIFLNYPKDINSDGSISYRCYDIFGNNQVDILNSSTKTIPQDFFYPNVCYRHFSYNDNLNNIKYHPYGTSNIFTQTYPYTVNQDWFMVEGLKEFKTLHPDFINYNYDLAVDYQNYIIANINDERSLVTEVKNVYELELPQYPTYIYFKLNDGLSISSGIEVNQPLEMINFNQYTDTTLTLINQGSDITYQNVKIGDKYYFRGLVSSLLDKANSYNVNSDNFTLNIDSKYIDIYVSDSSMLTAFNNFYQSGVGQQKLLININDTYNSNFQLANITSVNTSTKIVRLSVDTNTFNYLAAVKSGFTITPFLIKNTLFNNFYVSDVSQSNSYTLGYTNGDIFLSHIALADELFPGTSNSYNIEPNYGYRIYNNFSQTGDFHQNNFTDLTYFVFGTEQTTKQTGYYYPLITSSNMNVIDSSLGTSIVFEEYSDFIFYFPSGGSSVNASLSPPNINSSLTDFNKYNGIARVEVKTLPIHYTSSEIPNYNVPQIPSIIFPGWYNSNPITYPQGNYFIIDDKGRSMGFLPLNTTNTIKYAIEIVRNSSLNSKYFTLINNNDVPENVFTDKIRIYSNFLDNVTNNYNNTDQEFDIIINAQKGIVVEADYTVYRSPFLLEQGNVSSVCFDQYNRPLPPDTVIQMKPNSGQKLITYRQTPINATNIECGKYNTIDGTEISEYRQTNLLSVDSGACIFNVGIDFQTEGFYGMDGISMAKAICTSGTAGGTSCREPYFTRQLETDKDYYNREQFFDMKSNNHFYISKLDDNSQNKINNPKYWDEVKGLIRNEIVYNDEKFYITDDRTNQIYFYNVNLPGIVGELPIYYAANYMYEKQYSFYTLLNNSITDNYISEDNLNAQVFFPSKNLTTDYLNPGNVLSSGYNITYSNIPTGNNNFKLQLTISLDTNQIFDINVGDYIIVNEQFMSIFLAYSNFLGNPQSTNWDSDSIYTEGTETIISMELPTAVTIQKAVPEYTNKWYLFDPFDVIQTNTKYYVPLGSTTLLETNIIFPLIYVKTKVKVSNTSNLQNFYEGFNNRNNNPENFYLIEFDQIDNRAQSLSNTVQYNLKPYIANSNQLRIEKIEQDNIVTTIPYNINNNFIKYGVCTSAFGTSYGMNQYNLISNNIQYLAPSYFSLVKSKNITTPQAVLGNNTLFLSSTVKDKCMFIVETYYIDTNDNAFIREYAKDRYKDPNYTPKFDINDKLMIFLGEKTYECTIIDVSVRKQGEHIINTAGVDNTDIGVNYISNGEFTANIDLIFDYQVSFLTEFPPYRSSQSMSYGLVFYFKTYYSNNYACGIINDTTLVGATPSLLMIIFNEIPSFVFNAFDENTGVNLNYYSLSFEEQEIAVTAISEGFDATNIGTNNNIFVQNFFAIDNYKTQSLMSCQLYATRVYNNDFPDDYIQLTNIDVNAKPYGPAYVKNNVVSSTFNDNKTNEGYGSILSFKIDTNNQPTQNIIATAYPGLVFKTSGNGNHVFNITDQQIATFDFIASKNKTDDIVFKYNNNYLLNDVVMYKKPDFKIYYQNGISVPITYNNSLIADEKYYYNATKTSDGISGIYYPIYITNLNDSDSNRTSITFNEAPNLTLYTDSSLSILSKPLENTRPFLIQYMSNVGQWKDGVYSFFNEQNFSTFETFKTYLKGDKFLYNNTLYQADQDIYIDNGISPGPHASIVETFKQKLSTTNDQFYTFTTNNSGTSTLSQIDATEIYNNLKYNDLNLPYTTYNPKDNQMNYISEINNRGLCTGVATFNSVFNQFPNFGDYSSYMNKLIIINQGVCGVISMPSLFYGEQNISEQAYMKEDYVISIPPYLTSYLYSMPFGNNGDNVGKSFCEGNLEYGEKNVSNLRFANSVLFYPVILNPDSQDWYKLTFTKGTGVSYLNYDGNMKYNYSISSGTSTLINSDTNNKQIFGDITLKRNRINVFQITVPGTSTTFDCKIGDNKIPVRLNNIEFEYLPFRIEFLDANIGTDFSPNDGDIWYVSDDQNNILSHGVVDTSDSFTDFTAGSYAIYKYPSYPVPEGSKLYFKTTDSDYNSSYSNGVCLSTSLLQGIAYSLLSQKQAVKFDIEIIDENPFDTEQLYNFYDSDDDSLRLFQAYISDHRSMNTFSMYSSGTSITFNSTTNTSDDYFYLLETTDYLKIKMFGFFYNEEMASITYQNQQREYSNDGTSIPVLSFSPYKSQALIPEEERSITWGIRKEAYDVKYPDYFDVFNLTHKAENSFGLCAIAYNKPVSNPNRLLNLNNFINHQSNSTDKIGVVVTNSVTKIIADEIVLDNTMNIIGTIDDIMPRTNPYSPKAEYFNGLRKNLFTVRDDQQLNHTCFAYENVGTKQQFPTSPPYPLYVKGNGQIGVSGYDYITGIVPTLYNLNTVFDQSSESMNDFPLTFSKGINSDNESISFDNVNNIIKDNEVSEGICINIRYYIDSFNVDYDTYHNIERYNSYQNSREVILQAIAPYGTSPGGLAISMGHTIVDNDGNLINGNQYSGASLLGIFNYTLANDLLLN